MNNAFFLLLLLSALCRPTPVLSHDLGVNQAMLLQLDENSFELQVETNASLAMLFQPPRLPKHCSLTGEPRGRRGVGTITWEFRCKGRSLTAGDTLFLPWQREGVMLSADWLTETMSPRFFPRQAKEISVPLERLAAGSGSLAMTAKRYTVLGIEHILLGIDHLLFVLGLLFLVHGRMQLVKTITAFTVAHSITLALATLGFVNVPDRPVNAVVALSIVFLAVEILYARQGRTGLSIQHPWIVSFGFGLIHGLGFAGALTGIGIPAAEIPPALLFFNVGVEIGQLLFVLVYLGLIWSFKQLEVRFNPRLEPIPAYLIGSIAMYWFIGRAALIFST